MSSRITIRPMTYSNPMTVDRPTAGYCVRGTDERGRQVGIFVSQRWQADAIKRTIKTGGSDEAISAIILAPPFCTFDHPNTGLAIGRWARKERS